MIKMIHHCAGTWMFKLAPSPSTTRNFRGIARKAYPISARAPLVVALSMSAYIDGPPPPTGQRVGECTASGLRTPSALHDSLRHVAAQARGRLGVAMELLETGQCIVVNDAHRYPMQSVYKLPIAMAVLREVDRGRLKLDTAVGVGPRDFISAAQHSPIRDEHPNGAHVSVRELVRLAISESDGTASDVLLRLVGGPRSVAGYLRDLNVRDIEVATTEQQIGRDERAQFRDWATPSGLLSLLRVLGSQAALSDSNRTLLFHYLTVTQTGLNRLRGLLPIGTVVAHKTGSSRTVNGVTAVTNDVGILILPDGRHLAIVVMLTNSRLGDAARDSLIARVARAAWNTYASEGITSAGGRGKGEWKGRN
jgi:beta-lactamase class A